MDEGKSMTAKEKYIEFAQEHKEVCIYDSPWWLDTVCGGGYWDVVLTEENNRVTGALCFFVKHKFGLE